MYRFRTSREGPHRWPLVAGGFWLCCLCLLAVCAAPAQADQARILVLLGNAGGAYEEVSDALEGRLRELAPDGARIDVQVIAQSNGAFASLLDPRPDLIVAVGIRASTLALHNSGAIPVLSLLVPARDYAALSRVHADPQAQRSAIFLDQPLERQLDLLQLILPDTTRVASMGGPQSVERLQELRTLGTKRGLELAIETVPSGSNPIHPLLRLTDDAEALLALPDPDVFNRTSVQAILLTTYRNRMPVIGFSRAYVRAGALAAVYSSATHIGLQAGEWLGELVRARYWELGEPRYPDYYSVAVNAQVAQSLGIVIADEHDLLAQLQELETRRP